MPLCLPDETVASRQLQLQQRGRRTVTWIARPQSAVSLEGERVVIAR